jgi:hypothetical protein
MRGLAASVAILITAVAYAGENWRSFRVPDWGYAYFDEHSVKSLDGAKRVSVMLNYDRQQFRNSRYIQSVSLLIDVDCVTEALLLRGEEGYSSPIAKGAPFYIAFYNPRYQPPHWNPANFEMVSREICRP